MSLKHLAIVAALFAGVFGPLMLRRRGVYFSLMTLALSALGFTIAFRWTSFTGGENGLGGVERPVWGTTDLNDGWTFYIVVALIAFGFLFERLGFVICSLALLLLLMTVVDPVRPAISIPVSAS